MTATAKQTVLRILLAVVICLFLMPFIEQFDDIGGTKMSTRGIGLVTGAHSSVSVHYNWVDKESGATRLVTLGSMEPSIFAILAVSCVLLAVVLTFVKMKNREGLLFLLLIAGFAILIIMKLTIERVAEQQGYSQVLCRLEWAWGYWMACTFALVAAVVSLFPTKREATGVLESSK